MLYRNMKKLLNVSIKAFIENARDKYQKMKNIRIIWMTKKDLICLV